ncbi:Rrf2 family transcriptional regulator [Phenylobacterium sp.]|uniref:Rrf2 family transcriptional regulator n=1 Tax=Phenylobacterium sp. TaxID=1871053 RepID=UPI0035AF5F2D
MRRNSQLSGVLHVLLHMAEHDTPSTSEALAKAMATNPVVIRRILAGLRKRGVVRSEKGHGGGWSIARPLGEITLGEVYEALGSPELLAIGNRTETPDCLVERAVNARLGAVFHDAEDLILAGLRSVTLAALSADVHARAASGGARSGEEHLAHAR